MASNVDTRWGVTANKLIWMASDYIIPTRIEHMAWNPAETRLHIYTSSTGGFWLFRKANAQDQRRATIPASPPSRAPAFCILMLGGSRDHRVTIIDTQNLVIARKFRPIWPYATLKSSFNENLSLFVEARCTDQKLIITHVTQN